MHMHMHMHMHIVRRAAAPRGLASSASSPTSSPPSALIRLRPAILHTPLGTHS